MRATPPRPAVGRDARRGAVDEAVDPRDADPRDADPRVRRSRAKLLAAATALLVESGPAALTVDAVAERSGVAKSTLYRHWPSRNELLVDVMRANMPRFEPPDLTDGFEPALRMLLGLVADRFTDPEWASILPALIALKHHHPELTDVFAADRRAQLSVLAAVLELGVTEGRLPAGIDVQVAADLLIGPLLLATLSAEPGRVHGLARHVVDRFIASYAPAVPAGGPVTGGSRRPGRRPRRKP